jgi:Leucine-rich repeat (LRR) protein
VVSTFLAIVVVLAGVGIVERDLLNSLGSVAISEWLGADYNINRIRTELANYGIDIANNGTNAKASVLDNEGLSKITPRLERLGPTLRTLNLSGTRVSDLEPLKGLTALRSLYLGGTRVSSLEPLRGLVALRTLDLRGTKVSSLEPVYNLPKLRVEEIEGIPDNQRTGFIEYRGEKGLPY